MIRVLLPIKVVSVANLREHWSKRAERAKTQRGTAHTVLRATGKPPALPVTVTMTRIGARTLDTDNLAGGCKAARDGIADWLGVDDANSGVTWLYAQTPGKPKEYGLLVEVTACEI